MGSPAMAERNQHGIRSINHLMTFTGSFTRLTAKFASPEKQMQQGQRQLSTVLSSNYSFCQ
jgi:hypothetical protein